jgi:hypothetical protein
MLNVSTSQILHDLSLEAAKIAFTLRNDHQDSTPAFVAKRLLTDYLEANELLLTAWEMAESSRD